jgi:hypothetical protein
MKAWDVRNKLSHTWNEELKLLIDKRRKHIENIYRPKPLITT